MVRDTTMKLQGKLLPDLEEDLEVGYVEILVNIDEVLDEVPNEILRKYVEYHFDLIHPNDFDGDLLEDASEQDLVWELKKQDYNFTENFSDEDLVEELLERGYYFGGEKELSSLDYVDERYFEEIKSVFYGANFLERKLIHDLITKRNEI